MRIAKLLTALLCALPLASCGFFTPTFQTSRYPDGRVSFFIMSSFARAVCVDRIGVFELDDGKRGREIWSVEEDPPSNAICQSSFMFGETPEGFTQGAGGAGGPLVVGREYVLVAHAGFIRGNMRFTHELPENAAE